MRLWLSWVQYIKCKSSSSSSDWTLPLNSISSPTETTKLVSTEQFREETKIGCQWCSLCGPTRRSQPSWKPTSRACVTSLSHFQSIGMHERPTSSTPSIVSPWILLLELYVGV